MNPFSGRPTGRRFRVLGPDHLAGLAATGVALTTLIARGRRLDEAGRRRVRRRLVAALWGQEVAYHTWRAATGTWTPKEMLPLHLCSSVVWGGGVDLLAPAPIGRDLTWYWGMTGAPIALATPDIGDFTFPHFRYLQFFTSHGLVLALPLWNTFVDGRRPSARGWARAFGALLAQAGLAHAVNRRLGSNYLFIGRKIDTPSPLDWMPRWPYYVPILVVGTAGVFLLLGLPFRGEESAE